MALNEKVEIGKRVYTVRELTLQQIADLTGSMEANATSSLVALLGSCSDITVEELMPLAPSELDLVVEALIRVNTPFLQQAAKIEAKAAAAALERMIRSIFLIAFFPSSVAATE